MTVLKNKTSLYRGFSTQGLLTSRGKSFALSDVDLVKQDILNHIYTIKGERVMFPNFGTRIPLMAFEPLDEISLKIIEDDLREVLNAEPRVRVVDLAILPLPNNNAILALIDLIYVELNVAETFRLEFPVL
jgi:phage baseplate assembly protein W